MIQETGGTFLPSASLPSTNENLTLPDAWFMKEIRIGFLLAYPLFFLGNYSVLEKIELTQFIFRSPVRELTGLRLISLKF
ncbi:MAG: hypothetical protein KAW12_13320 [Candidatus Aminicenantes bacterium]|nr:hypothetical protein [Candidatus Aminicenantes bacterium]